MSPEFHPEFQASIGVDMQSEISSKSSSQKLFKQMLQAGNFKRLVDDVCIGDSQFDIQLA